MRTPLSTFKKAPRRSARPAAVAVSRMPPPPIRLTSKAPPPPPPDDEDGDGDDGIIVLDDVVTDEGFGLGTLVARLRTLFARPPHEAPSPRP